MNVGTCLLRLERYAQAIEEFGKAVGLRPDYAKAFSKRAHCHEMLEE